MARLVSEVALPCAPTTLAEAELAAEVAALEYEGALIALLGPSPVGEHVRSLSRLAELADQVSRARLAYGLLGTGDVRA